MFKITEAGKPKQFPDKDYFKKKILEDDYNRKKIARFLQCGYAPHQGQMLFHLSRKTRKAISSGRRGGKTTSAAQEAAELSHPDTALEALKANGVKIEKLLRPDGTYKIMDAAIIIPQLKHHGQCILDFQEALRARGLREGKDFRYHKTDGIISIFDRAGRLFMRVYVKAVAANPDSLRGIKLVWGWYDEPGFLPSRDAWNINRPSYSDYNGIVMFTTSPSEENNLWFYEDFIRPESQGDENFLISWTSADNPFIERSVIEEARRQDPPHVFAREWLAEWKRPTGNVLQPSWLHYYKHYRDPNPAVGFVSDLRTTSDNQIDKKYYDFYVGIDPAITPEQMVGTDHDPDYTVAVIIAKDKETGIGYVIDMRRERLSFPEQLELIQSIKNQYNPSVIGIDATAYQRSLSQMLITLPGFQGQKVVPVNAPGSKSERIPWLGPIAKSGVIRFNEKMTNRDSNGRLVFEALYEEWRDFPKAKHDDTLDAIDICIRAGNLFGDYDETFIKNLKRIEEESRDAQKIYSPRILDKERLERHNAYITNRNADEEDDFLSGFEF